MSCLPELTWAIYADGELGGQEARRADAHLVHCEACRARVLAVREETLLLARSFQEREPGEPVDRASPLRARRPLLFRPLLLLPIALLLGIVGTFAESRLAVGGSIFGGLDPRTLVARFLGAIFLLRDRAPGVFELVVAVAATASASALASFAVTGLLQRWTRPVLVLVLLGLAPAQVADAFQRRSDDDVRIGPGERVEGSLLASGERVEVEGTVAGDLLAAADSVRIRGVVEGNLFVFADELEIEGRVDGSVFAGVERLRVLGRVGGSLYVGGQRLELAATSRAERSVYLFADHASLEGPIGRDLVGIADRVALDGTVGRDLEIRARSLAFRPAARIDGDARVFLPPGRGIEGVSAGRVGGELSVEPHRHATDAGLERFLQAGFWIWLAIRIAAAFLVGIVLHALVPGLFRPEWTPPGRTLGLGLLVLVGAPILLALLGLTLVGLPLAIFGAFAYLAALYAAGVLVAGRLGAAMIEPEAGSRRAFGLALLTGLGVLAVGASLPFFGPVVRILAALVGLGILAQLARDRLAGRPVLT